MSIVDFKAKNSKISFLIENSNCPEDILNNKTIDLENDFSYICINSSINYDLVNDVIARLAQNGNIKIVEENICNITFNMWKDLFYKNKNIKDLFIKNFDSIIDDAGILTYRDMEKMIDDNDIRCLIYNSIPKIVKKLCTYDRAAFISDIYQREDGINQIKGNMKEFFKKGEYDISTTYSKILIQLDKIEELTKLEIIESFIDNLSEMLERETAIDNETNDLLCWIYDAIEETKMDNEKKNVLQEKIDEAILQNFDCILDKSNYDKNTITVLKQFSCTINKFDESSNELINKSEETTNNSKIYDFCNVSDKEEDKEEAEKSLIDTLAIYNIQQVDAVVSSVLNQDINKEYNEVKTEKKLVTEDKGDDMAVDINNVEKSIAIIDSSEELDLTENKNVFMRFWDKIKKIFSYFKTDRIGE